MTIKVKCVQKWPKYGQNMALTMVQWVYVSDIVVKCLMTCYPYQFQGKNFVFRVQNLGFSPGFWYSFVVCCGLPL